MAQQDIDVLKKLRSKLVEQRRSLAIRQSSTTYAENNESIITLQGAIEAVDHAIADEEALLSHLDSSVVPFKN